MATFLLLLLVAVLLGTASSLQAATVTAAWDANSEPDIAGYVLSFGTQSGVYTTTIDVGRVTSTPVAVTAGLRYFFVVQAYNTGGLVSPRSAEVFYDVPGVPGPYVASLSPASGVVGTVVTIAGANFGATRGTSTVTFNGVAATPTTWSATSLSVPVPTGATTGLVVVRVGGVASNGLPFTVNATKGALPFGAFDAPVNGATGVTGSIGVTGWALDDVGVSGVKIYRNCLSIDNPASCQAVNGANVVFIGDAAFLAGARPDVEAAYASYPFASRAGWGYLMLTNMLPHLPNGNPAGGGQGTLTISAYATDVGGQRVLLGQKTITLDNDHAVRPFGAIDTPSQGGAWSGVQPNFGWALTPGTALIPTNGSTMRVVIDGAFAGNVSYNQCRDGGTLYPDPGTCADDIATLFPGYTNIVQGSGAIGSFVIDTTALSNGAHTIAWGVVDNQGRNDGIGSRFFIVQNGSSLTAATSLALSEAPAQVLGDAAAVVWRSTSPSAVWGRTGFDFGAPREAIAPDMAGVRHIRLPELGRLELALGDDVHAGYLRADGTLRPLPAGSRLDPVTGLFTWAPGPGYVGTYDLVFLQGEAQIALSVTIQPKTAETRGRMRGYVDLPAPGTRVSGTFTVAGWALDLDAWQGAGVGTVHVWAERRDVPAAVPAFLGVAEVGGLRPDVAAVFGPQFDRAGWGFTAAGVAPGLYDVTAYFWSSRTGQFEDARTVRVTVR